MKIIALSNPVAVAQEHERICALFEQNMDCFHLRKPGTGKEEFENFLKAIAPRYYKHIVIHAHFQLIEKYNLRGIHLPEHIRQDAATGNILKAAKRRRITVSTSVHSLEEIEACNAYDYVFLSPVFDSISKEGYGSRIDLNDFKQYRKNSKSKTQIIALGGVDTHNITLLAEAGFDGAAVLGAVWSRDAGEALSAFQKIREAARTFSNV